MSWPMGNRLVHDRWGQVTLKGQSRDPIRLEPNISKTAGDLATIVMQLLDSLLWGSGVAGSAILATGWLPVLFSDFSMISYRDLWVSISKIIVRKLKQTRPNHYKRKCPARIIVSGDIKFMWIFAGILWKWGVNQTAVRQKTCSCLSTVFRHNL